MQIKTKQTYFASHETSYREQKCHVNVVPAVYS
jgi:hypothetical protein